jgi:hypothetical protein
MSDPATMPPTDAGGGTLPRPRSRTWPVVLLGLVILICGNVIGAGTAVLWLKQYLPPRPPPDRVAPDRIAADLRDRYNLSEEQARKVREIMQRSIEELDAIHRDTQEKAEAEREKLRGEMKTVLTPEQYAQWLAQFEALGARRGPPGGPDRPGMGGRPGQFAPGQGPGGGRPGMGGGPGPGQGPGPGRPQPPGMGRGPGPEGGPPMRPQPPEGRRGPLPAGLPPAGLPPAGNRLGGLEPIKPPPGGPEAARPQEPPPGQ